MNIHQEQLHMFQLVVETGSFSAAARQLGKVPSAVSMAIANLEIDLNIMLFDRSTREPKPTAQAITLYQKTLQLLTEMNAWKQHAIALGMGLEPVLNIVIVSELVHSNWTDYITILEEKFPSLEINIFSAPQEDAISMLWDQRAQLAIMFEREQLDNREQFIELKKETLVPVIAREHALAHNITISNEQLLNIRQIVVASRDQHIKPSLVFSKTYWRTDSHYSLCTLVLKKLGWGIIPLQMFNDNPHLKEQLQILELSDFTPSIEYYMDLVWSRESQLGSAAKYLIEYLQKQRQTNHTNNP